MKRNIKRSLYTCLLVICILFTLLPAAAGTSQTAADESRIAVEAEESIPQEPIPPAEPPEHTDTSETVPDTMPDTPEPSGSGEEADDPSDESSHDNDAHPADTDTNTGENANDTDNVPASTDTEETSPAHPSNPGTSHAPSHETQPDTDTETEMEHDTDDPLENTEDTDALSPDDEEEEETDTNLISETPVDTPSGSGTSSASTPASSNTNAEEKPASIASNAAASINQTKTFFDVHPVWLILVKVVLIALLTYALLRFSRNLWNKNQKNNQILFRKFVYNIIQTCICAAGILLAIGQIPQLSRVVQTILAGSGILALAISLSAQESLNNIISGMFITLFKPFEVGDRVTLVGAGITGTIEDITLRHTFIKTFTNTRIVVPNAKINQEMIENSNIVDSRVSTFIDVTIAYESDIDKAIEIMAHVIGTHPLFLDLRTEDEKEYKPKVKVYIRNLGETGIALRASMWTREVAENYEACSDVRLQIKKSFDAAGIEIPYTKYMIIQQNEH